MNSLQGFLYTVLFAAVVENLVFARAIGADGLIITHRHRGILLFGAAVTLVSLFGGALAWIMRYYFGEQPYWSDVRWLAAFLSVTAAYLLVTVLLGNRFLLQERGAEKLLIAAAYNGAALGTVLLSLTYNETFLHTVAYCLGCSLGLVGAMMLIHSGREQLSLSQVPKSFRGLPITLIYIGILSLAIYGLIGHQLPT